MSDFKFEKKDSYTFDELNKLLDQKAEAHEKTVLSAFSEKEKQLEQLLTEKKERQTNDFLSKVEEKNHGLVKDLLGVKTPEEIEKNYSHLFKQATPAVEQPEKVVLQFADIQSLLGEQINKDSASSKDSEILNKTKNGQPLTKEEKIRYADLLREKENK